MGLNRAIAEAIFFSDSASEKYLFKANIKENGLLSFAVYMQNMKYIHLHFFLSDLCPYLFAEVKS